MCSSAAFAYLSPCANPGRGRVTAFTPICLAQPGINHARVSFALLADVAATGKDTALDAASKAAAAAADAVTAASKSAADVATSAAGSTGAAGNSNGTPDIGYISDLLGFADFILLVVITIGIGILTYQNSIIRRNDRRSRDIIGARIAQFGGEEKVNPEDRIFSEQPGTKGSRVPWPGGKAPTFQEFMDPKTDVKSLLSSSRKPKLPQSSGSNRSTRRRAAVIERREKKLEQTESKSKDDAKDD